MRGRPGNGLAGAHAHWYSFFAGPQRACALEPAASAGLGELTILPGWRRSSSQCGPGAERHATHFLLELQAVRVGRHWPSAARRPGAARPPHEDPCLGSGCESYVSPAAMFLKGRVAFRTGSVARKGVLVPRAYGRGRLESWRPRCPGGARAQPLGCPPKAERQLGGFVPPSSPGFPFTLWRTYEPHPIFG